MPSDAHLTERQRKWFESVRSGLERDTGKSLDEWVKIARTCPETKHRARLKWSCPRWWCSSRAVAEPLATRAFPMAP